MNDEIVEIRHGIGDLHVIVSVRDFMGFDCSLPLGNETVGTVIMILDRDTVAVSRRGFKQIVTIVGMGPDGEIQKYRDEVQP